MTNYSRIAPEILLSNGPIRSRLMTPILNTLTNALPVSILNKAWNTVNHNLSRETIAFIAQHLYGRDLFDFVVQLEHQLNNEVKQLPN